MYGRHPELLFFGGSAPTATDVILKEQQSCGDLFETTDLNLATGATSLDYESIDLFPG